MSLVILNAGQNYQLRGGSERYQFILSELLEKNGHTVIPFAAANPKNLSSKWSSYFPRGVNFEHPSWLDLAQFIYSIPAAEAIKRLLKNHPLDVAHLHIYYGQLTASILAPLQQAGVPIVQTLHEYKIVCPVYTLVSQGEICQACQGHNFWYATLRRCNRGSVARSLLSTIESYVSKLLGSVRLINHFIAVSHFQRQKVIELGVPAEKVTTIHNFIDTKTIKPNSKPGEYFLYFGRLERLKGLFTLIEAAASLKEIPLLIVGDGEARLELEQLIEQNQYTHIQLLGFKQGNELTELIYHSICTVVPSEWYETFGFTLVESFAQGRPVIASNIGGISEVVTDRVDGILVPPRNAAVLREKMLWLAEHPHDAVAMGQAGRRKVETLFNSNVHYEKLMDVYRKVL